MSQFGRTGQTFANVAQSQTDALLVTGTPGFKIKVWGVAVLAGGTGTTLVFNTATGGSGGAAISMTFANAANGGFVLPFSETGWFQTATGDYLTCTTGAGSTTGIQLLYTFEL